MHIHTTTIHICNVFYCSHNHKDTNSSIRSRSSSRYENNPIKHKKRRSRSPRNSPQPEQQQPEQFHSAHDDQFFISNNSVYSNLRRTSQQQEQQQQQYQPLQQQLLQQTQPPVSDAIVSHPNEGLYEVLPAEDIDTTQTPPQSAGANEQSVVVQQQQSSVPDNSHKDVEDEPYIAPSYTTVINPPDTFTETFTDNSTQEVVQREYSEVPTPPTPNKNERSKVVKKGKRPESSEEYTDPTPNGVALMKKMKSSSMKQSPNSSPGEQKQRRASESARPGFEEWSIKSTGAPTYPTLDESNV